MPPVVSAHRAAPSSASPQSSEEAEGPWRLPPTRSTYRWERKEGDGEDREAGGDGLPHPRLRHLVPVADGGDRDLRAGGTAGGRQPQDLRTGVCPAGSPSTRDLRAQRPRRERCTDGPGSSEARAPVHTVWSPRLNAAKEASPWHVHGRSACPCHPTPCPRRPTAQEARSRPPRPILHREPGHRWHAASRCQPGQQMLHAPFSLGEPDEPSSPLAGGSYLSRARAGTVGWRLLPPMPPIPPQAHPLLASEAGSRGPGPTLAVPACTRARAVGCLLGFRGVGSEPGKGTQGAQSPSSSRQHMYPAL